MNDNFALVDEIARRTGGTATIFQGDTRIATTVRKMGTDERAIGTQAAPNVVEQVLQKGKPYYGEALVAGHWYQTAYTPLRDAEGRKRQAP
ncbi:MAG: cache domain-containing protein [Betaproteobacteria bacterium]